MQCTPRAVLSPRSRRGPVGNGGVPFGEPFDLR